MKLPLDFKNQQKKSYQHIKVNLGGPVAPEAILLTDKFLDYVLRPTFKECMEVVMSKRDRGCFLNKRPRLGSLTFTFMTFVTKPLANREDKLDETCMSE